MRAFDDEVSYTRIIDPAPQADEMALPAPGDQPQLVWRPRLGDQQAYPLTGRITKVGFSVVFIALGAISTEVGPMVMCIVDQGRPARDQRRGAGRPDGVRAARHGARRSGRRRSRG